MMLKSFWTEQRVEQLKLLAAQKHTAAVIARRMGTSGADVKRALRQHGIVTSPVMVQDYKALVPDLARRLRILAAATDHTAEDLVANGWANSRGVAEDQVEAADEAV